MAVDSKHYFVSVPVDAFFNMYFYFFIFGPCGVMSLRTESTLSKPESGAMEHTGHCPVYSNTVCKQHLETIASGYFSTGFLPEQP